ncbi:MAG: PRD domain-containing protein [Lactobacillus sp.]|uniref:Transcription antiterminator BglG n=1 Tax=Bombilactobacillus bombi TaxID=1303590 RepID=A0A3R6ZUM6_9LACO|nr:PRD domain-containing protein [Bombilactobacillus bombi]MCO6542196.1 PRD domain-containing protein [Lactobacillus sp.]RHW45431.1 transcription antiterminator BglG [Bombilactobacillus bombi]
MLIQRILNNNTVIAQKQNQQMVLAFGPGIGYQKKIGQSLNKYDVEKVLEIHDPDTFNRFTDLVINVPSVEVSVAEKIINFAKIKLGKNLSEVIYVDLTDHLHSFVQRYHEHLVLHNSLKWDIARLYPDEYAVGEKALQIIKQYLNLKPVDDEAAFIALHFINAESGNELADEIVKIVREIEQIVKDYYHTELDEDSLSYYRFITHLKFFAQRCLLQQHYDDEDDALLAIIQEKYAKAYSCAKKVQVYISNKYRYRINNTEVLYLTVHINRLVKNLN